MGRGGLRRGPYDPDAGEVVPLVTFRANARADRVREYLEQSPVMRGAAIVADRWHMDIVDVLDEADPLRRVIRVAGHNLLAREENRHRPGG